MKKLIKAGRIRREDFMLKPVLKEHSGSRYFAFSFLYFGQGVPEGITFGAIPAWMAMNGIPAETVATYLAMVALPWSFKLIIAPLMDRYTIKAMGRKRPWVILGQLGLITSFMLLSFIPSPLNQISLLTAVAFTISVFGCFQDVATDGMAVDVIPAKEQARANGLMWGSKVLGYSATLSIGSMLINTMGFHTAVLVPALFTSLIILIPIFFRERSGEKLMPWTNGRVAEEVEKLQVSSFKLILKDVLKVFLLPSSLVLSFIGFLIGATKGFGEVVFPLFTIQEMGWLNTDFANVSASSYFIGGVAGMLIGGALVDLYGKKRMLYIYLGTMAVLSSGFLFHNSPWFNSQFIAMLIGGMTAFIVFAHIAFFATCMQHCWLRVSATQFTLYMTIGNLGTSIGSKSAGMVESVFHWHWVFVVYTMIILFALLFIGFLSIKNHLKKIEFLESEKVPSVS